MKGRGHAVGWLLVAAALTAAAPLEAQEPARPVEDVVATAPVEIDGVVLFRMRGVSSFPAAARAQRVRDRIVAIASDRAVPVESLRVVDTGAITVVSAGDRTVVGVVDADAALEQVGRAELAYAHMQRVSEAIAEYRAARSAGALRRSALNTLLASVVLALGLAGVLWVFRWLNRLLMRRLQSRIHSVGIQSFEVMRAERIWGALQGGLTGLRSLVLLAATLVYLGVVLAQWPWTRGMARDVVGFALAPLRIIGDGVIANIPNLAFLAVLFVVVRFALRMTRLFFEAVGRGTVVLGGFDADWAQPTYKIVRVAIVAFGLIVAYPHIPGSESAAFKGLSLFLGVVFSLGSSSAISNVIAGYMMTYRRAFRVGDRVRIGGAVGDVIEMRLQVTHLRSFKNEEIVIPNSQILSGEVLNYSSLARVSGLILHTEIGIGYETPWRQVEAMLLEAAGRTPNLVREPKPFVLVKKLGDFAVVYELNVYCQDVKAMNQQYADLHRAILDVFNEYGVQIMTPAYEGDPGQPKVVAKADWYTAPAQVPADLVAAGQGR